MGNAKFVGRVGALAVALGIGAAIGGATGQAWADTGTNDAGSSSSAEASSSEGATSTSGDSSVNGDQGAGNSSSEESDAADDDDDADEDADARHRGKRSECAEKPSAATQDVETAADDDESEDTGDDAPAASDEPEGETAVEGDGPSVEPAADDAPPADISDEPAPTPPTIEQVAVVDTSGAAALTSAGAVDPATPPTVWTLATLLLTGQSAAFRNSLEQVLHNKAPVLDPDRIDQNPFTGVVRGTFNAVDANGDVLKYTIIDAPDDGTVTIDAVTGRFTYTPYRQFAFVGGWDGFSVVVDDAGFHLFDSVAPETIYVSVWVDPVAPDDYIEPSPTAGQSADEEPLDPWPGWLQALRNTVENWVINKAPVVKPIDVHADEKTGVVLGTLNAADPNADRLRYTIVGQPTSGTVLIDDDGGYFYRVDPTSALAATGGTDTFSVRVVDLGWRMFDSTEATVVEVTVTVPKVTAPTANEEIAAPTSGAPQAGIDPVRYNFDVHNHSAEPVRLSYTSTTAKLLFNSPADGTVLQPNQSMHFQVILNYGRWSDAELTFTTTATSVIPYSYTVHLGVPQRFVPASTGVVKCTGTCTPGDSGNVNLGDTGNGPGGFYLDTANVVLLDRPGTQRQFGPNDVPLQESVMNEFCALDKVKCTWGTKTLNKAYGAFTQALPPYDNYNATQSEPLPSDSFEVSHQWAFGLKIIAKVTAKFTDIIGAEVSGEFNATWTTGRKYTRQYAGTAPPQRRFIVWKAPAVLRLAGDVTVQYGNTTYVVQNVGADMPDVRAVGDGEKPRSITGREPDWIIGQPLKLTTDAPPDTYDPKLTLP